MKIAFVDIDGVVANADARFKQAMADADAVFEGRSYEQREYNDYYWRAVFNPDYIPLDTLIDEGVNEALLALQEGDRGYKIIFMTSRPESMSHATRLWLFEHTVYDTDDDLILKPSAFQYTKTPVWKAGMVQTLARLYHASQVLVIDDEQFNLDEIVKQATQPPVVPGLMIAKSLAEAVAKLNGTWEEPDPFMPDYPDE